MESLSGLRGASCLGRVVSAFAIGSAVSDDVKEKQYGGIIVEYTKSIHHCIQRCLKYVCDEEFIFAMGSVGNNLQKRKYHHRATQTTAMCINVYLMALQVFKERATCHGP